MATIAFRPPRSTTGSDERDHLFDPQRISSGKTCCRDLCKTWLASAHHIRTEAHGHCAPSLALLVVGLARLQARPDRIHTSGEILFAQEPAAEHDMRQGQKLLLRPRRPTVDGLAELILCVAPFQRRQSGAGGQTFTGSVQADFPGRIRVGETWFRRGRFSVTDAAPKPPARDGGISL